jgi:hypothetical protein
MNISDARELIGAKPGDPADLRPCRTRGYMVLPTNVRIHEWEGSDRAIPAPPQIDHGPFSELCLAPTPAAATLAAIGRSRVGSERPIWHVTKDILGWSVYAVEATGVRIRDRHRDSRLVGGTPALRQEGENARARLVREDRELVASGAAPLSTELDEPRGPVSDEWTALGLYFEESVAAIEIPSDSALQTTKADWCLVVSIPRIRVLEKAEILRFEYLGARMVRFRDLLKTGDVSNRSVTRRIAYFFGREVAHDVFSIRRQQGFRDWLRFGSATLGFAGGLGGLGWLLSHLASVF